MNICTILRIQNFLLFYCWRFKWCQYFYLTSCLSIVLDWSNDVYNLNDVSMMMSACWHCSLTSTWKCFFHQLAWVQRLQTPNSGLSCFQKKKKKTLRTLSLIFWARNVQNKSGKFFYFFIFIDELKR